MATSSAVRVAPSLGDPSAAPQSAPHVAASSPPVIRFANYLSTALAPFYQGVADYAAQRLGRPTAFVEGSIAGDLAAGKVDVGFL
ncbi:MAG: hypothetical protein ACYC6T_14185 [Thermoleophilia bacterium]